MPAPQLLRLLRNMPQIRRQETRPDGPDLDAILLQLVIPIQHHHIKRRLAAAIADGLKVDFLRPAGGLRRGGEILLARHGHVGEAGHEDEAGVGRLEQEGHEGPGHDLRAGDVHVVGLVKAVAQGGLAGDEFDVKSGAWWM